MSIFSVVSFSQVMCRRVGYPHQAGGAVRLAAAVAWQWSHAVGHLAARVVQRHAGVIALGRRDHAPAPVLVDDRHPVPGQVDRRRRPGRRRRGAGGRTRATALLAPKKPRSPRAPRPGSRASSAVLRPVSSQAARAATQISLQHTFDVTSAAGCDMLRYAASTNASVVQKPCAAPYRGS